MTNNLNRDISDCLLIEGCDFQSYPPGGQLTFAKQMMKTFGNRLALVGISTDSTPTGQWVVKEIDGERFHFFCIGHFRPLAVKPLIPHRMHTAFKLVRYKKEILSLGVSNVFLQAPELLIASSGWRFNSICYRFPGVANPLRKSRYSWSIFLAPLFDKLLFMALEKVEVILASADRKAIDGLIERSRGRLNRGSKVVQFPTRVDMQVFHPVDKEKARSSIKIDQSPAPLFVTCGRIHKSKGWSFILKSFRIFKKKYGGCKLIFVGDGEDRGNLEEAIYSSGLDEDIRVVGFQNRSTVSLYLNAADAVIVGSREEGWPTTMLEALACGRAIVSTDVSGASDIIIPGFNGYVVPTRDPEQFATHMKKVMTLKTTPAAISAEIAKKYSTSTIADELSYLWKPLS